MEAVAVTGFAVGLMDVRLTLCATGVVLTTAGSGLLVFSAVRFSLSRGLNASGLNGVRPSLMGLAAMVAVGAAGVLICALGA